MKEGWEYKKLGEVCEIVMGQSPDGNSVNSSEGIEFHQGKTFFGEKFLEKSDSYTNAPTKLAEENSVLLCVRAPVGFPNITKRKICIGRGLCSLFPSSKVLSTFLYYSLLSKQDYFENNATGSTFKAISSKIVNETNLAIPNITKQQSIVSELDLINDLITKKKAQLKDLDSLAQSLFYEMFGDPVENEKGWEVKKLGETFKVTSSKRVMQEEWTDEGVPFYKVSDLINVISHSSTDASVYISEQKYQELLECNAVPKEFDILVTARGTIGKCYVISRNDRFYFQDGMITWLTENNGSVLPCYIVGLFNSARFIENLCSSVNQSTVAYLSIKQLSSKHVPLPPLSLQQTFASRIEAIEEEKQKIQSSLKDLETLLASRMQYWFD